MERPNLPIKIRDLCLNDLGTYLDFKRKVFLRRKRVARQKEQECQLVRASIALQLVSRVLKTCTRAKQNDK